MLMTQDSIDRLKMLCMSVLSLRGWHGSLNPFLSAHIPYAQSEGILPKYGLLQWVEIYIKKYSMNFDQTLQRHGRGIELSKNIKILVTFDLHSRSRDPRWPPNTFFKVKFGPKTTHSSANFWSNSIIFCFVLLLETSSPLWMEKQYQQWFHVSSGSRETTLL